MDKSNVLPGKEIAQALQESLRLKVASYATQMGQPPKLTIIQVGQDDASALYIRNKLIALKKIGLLGDHIHLPQDISQKALLDKVQAANADPGVHGIIVQLPLPNHINKFEIVNEILPSKDVDGLTFFNQGLLFNGSWAGLLPCTPLGCLYLLHRYKALRPGVLALVIGRSNLVGKPMATLLLNAGCTTISTHKATKNLAQLTVQADIIVTAAGCAKLLTHAMIKPGAFLIDVGINRLSDGALSGDIDFVSAQPGAKGITPVPGGVGPLTVTMLMLNTLQAAYKAQGIDQCLYRDILGLRP